MSIRRSRALYSTLIRIIIILLGLIYGLLFHIHKVPEELNAAILVTLLLFMAEQFVELGHKISALTFGHRESERRVFDSSRHPILGMIKDLVQKEIDGSLTVDEDKFVVSNPYLAIKSYADFWKLLIAEQERLGSAHRLTVEAIHSCEMNIWNTGKNTWAEKLLEYQADFCRAGGSITRILCGQGSDPGPDTISAYTAMKAVEINVVTHDFEWDFLRVIENDDLVIWSSFSRGQGKVIGRATYCKLSHPEYKEVIDEIWKDISKYSVKIDVEGAKTM